MAFKKYARKAFTTVKKAAKKRYGTKTGGVRMTQLMRDVALVKRSLNVEKKHIQSIVANSITVGQCNGNTDTGYSILDVTPAIVQGVGYSNMTGNSVKLVSVALHGQIRQQSATQHPMRVRVVLYKVVGTPIPVATQISGNQLYDVNPLTSLTDYNSTRNTNYFRQFKILKTKTLYIQPDPTSGEMMISNFAIIMKMSHHLKFNQNSTTLTDGQICCAVYADSGNGSASTASTNTTIPVTKINSGAFFQYYTKYYFVDN